MPTTSGFVGRVVVWCVYAAVAGTGLWSSVYRPFHNWDVVGYIGAAKAFELDDARALHAFTYGELRSVLDAGAYADIARENSAKTDGATLYRRAISSDPSAFAEQLPFYQIRPLYTGLIFVMYAAGVEIEFATHLISGIAVGAGLLIVCAVAAPRVGPLALLLPLFAIQVGLLDLTKFSTADGLAFLAVMCAIWCYASSRLHALLVALVLMLGARTDLILLSAPLLLALFCQEKKHRWSISLAALASVGVYAAIVGHWHNPGWSTFFSCTLVQRCSHPLSNPPVLAIHDYIRRLGSGLLSLGGDADFAVYVIIVCASVFLICKRWAQPGRELQQPATLIAVSTVYVAARFLVLPAEWARAFPTPYLLSAFSLLWLAYPRGQQRHANNLP